MPTASSIQVVNDANGTAYAFLADNGSLWQCQWNAQAQRWDRGQIVPGAYGGEQMQALVLEDLWPTESQGISGSKPGIVLAYRVGEGANAEVVASFGQWGGDGQLRWTVPVALTDDQVEDQAFALVESASGGFSLVVQKQQAATTVEALLDKLGAVPSDQLEAALKLAASAERPDSDLYATSFAIELDASGQPQLTDLLAGTTSALSAPPPPTVVAAAPLALGGNVQLSRQQLITPPLASPTLRQAGPTQALQSAAPATGTSGGGVSWQGGAAGQANFSNGGALRVGVLVGQNLLRWQLPNRNKADLGTRGDSENVVNPAEYTRSRYSLVDDSESSLSDFDRERLSTLGNSSSSFELDASDIFGELLNPPPSSDLEEGGLRRRAFSEVINPPSDLLDVRAPGSGVVNIFGYEWSGSDLNPVHVGLLLRGTLGLFNAGLGGPTVLSTFKFAVEAGNNSTENLFKSGVDEVRGIKEEWTKVKSGNALGFGGTSTLSTSTKAKESRGWCS